jgi:hypothetical protein
VVCQAVYSEVLSKLPILKVVPGEVRFPMAICFELIDHDRTLLSAVTCEIRLAIAVQIQSPGKDSVRYGMLPDRCANELSLPFNLARKTDIY